MVRHIIRISEVEAAETNLATLLARVRAGAEVVIEDNKRPIAVLHTAGVERRTIAECIALAKTHEEETGSAPVLDADFAEDLEEILRQRAAWNPPAWE